MTDQRATGLILRVRPLTETSLIIHWLTVELGRIATVAKGARRPKSPFRGKLDLFYSADLSFQPSRKSDLHNLREVVLRETFAGLRSDLSRLQCASYCCELIELATETETPIPDIHQLLHATLQYLATHTPTSLQVFAFELKLLTQQGVQPDLANSRLSPGSRKILEQLTHLDFPTADRLRLSPAQSAEIAAFLRHALAQGFERDLKTRESLLHDLR